MVGEGVRGSSKLLVERYGVLCAMSGAVGEGEAERVGAVEGRDQVGLGEDVGLPELVG